MVLCTDANSIPTGIPNDTVTNITDANQTYTDKNIYKVDHLN